MELPSDVGKKGEANKNAIPISLFLFPSGDACLDFSVQGFRGPEVAFLK
jgi:hypothetical protein